MSSVYPPVIKNALWQPGGAEEDSRLREDNRHLHLAYDGEEDLLQITQLCGLCCVKEATVRLINCDSFMPVTAVEMQFLFLPGKRSTVNLRNFEDCRKTHIDSKPPRWPSG